MRRYSNWLHAYLAHTRYSESPDSFHLWTGVFTVAGALRRRVWIDQRHFQWTPNFYVVLVGPPGIAAKSTSVRSGISLLEKLPDVHFGPQSMTWQALTMSLKDAQEGVLIPGLDEPELMSCVNIGVGELGTFLRTDDQELVDFLTAMWDGQKEVWRRRTKGEGETTITNPWLNIIACTTPAWLKANFPDVLIGGGLTSRMVFVYEDQKRQLVAYPADLIASKSYQLEEEALIHDLLEIAELRGEYAFSNEAKSWGVSWYENLWRLERPEHLSGDRFSGYVSRKQTHLHKLAMVVAASKRNEMVLEQEDLFEADQMLTAVEVYMHKVFSSIGVSQGAAYSEEIRGLLRNLREVSYKRLWQLCFNRVSSDEFVKAVQANILAGYAQKETRNGEIFIVYKGKK